MSNKDLKDFISINELAKIIGSNKSTLLYYISVGLLHPEATIGKMYIFSKKNAVNDFKRIKKYREEGKSLEEIKSILNTK